MEPWWIVTACNAVDSPRVPRRARPPDPDAAAVALTAGRLRTLRRARGMTQEDVASAAGLSGKYVSEIENARTNASIGTVARIAAALGVSLSAFFNDGDQTVIGDLATVTAIIGAQSPAARQQAIRFLRALYTDRS
ncbi:MAG TPA: helix-turn-helix transcriptional regulator [Kofleriaceae bacterium]|nr:helix-turn-helix transcriptional regulator [Kofleriaceae bacterium]